MSLKARVHVYLKPGVLDVQGKAVEGALHGLGWPEVSRCRRLLPSRSQSK